MAFNDVKMIPGDVLKKTKCITFSCVPHLTLRRIRHLKDLISSFLLLLLNKIAMHDSPTHTPTAFGGFPAKVKTRRITGTSTGSQLL